MAILLFHSLNQVASRFTSDAQGFSLTDSMMFSTHTSGLDVNSRTRELVYRNANSLPPSVYYWKLPGNKVTSYGGSLRFTTLFRPGFDTSTNSYPDVVISVSTRIASLSALIYLPSKSEYD